MSSLFSLTKCREHSGVIIFGWMFYILFNSGFIYYNEVWKNGVYEILFYIIVTLCIFDLCAMPLIFMLFSDINLFIKKTQYPDAVNPHEYGYGSLEDTGDGYGSFEETV